MCGCKMNEMTVHGVYVHPDVYVVTHVLFRSIERLAYEYILRMWNDVWVYE